MEARPFCLIKICLICGNDVNGAIGSELDDPGSFCKKREIVTAADEISGAKPCAPLPNDDASSLNKLSSEDFDAEPFGLGIASVG